MVLIAFTAFKIHHLYYPYYWDESWPYATAVADMYKHGISLLPGAVDPNLSRGHPLFFHAAAATWGKIFGMSHFSMHSFALLISLLFLMAIYEAGLKLFNIRVAVLSLLLVTTQVLFIVQSGMLLLEMLVALLAFVSLYSYVRGHYFLTGLFLFMLFYTKESGLIMGFVLGIDTLVRLAKANKQTFKEHIPRLLAIGIPCMLMGAFFLLQKKINGWYILPLYSDLVEHNWNNFWYVFRRNVNGCMFVSDYRFWYYFIAGALTLYAAITRKLWGLATMVLPILLVYFMVGEKGPKEYGESIAHFVALLLSMGVFTWFMARPSLFPATQQRRFIALTMAFIVCFLIFSAFNFFTYRYLLATIIPGLMLIAVITDKVAERTQSAVYYIAFAGMMFVSGYAYIYDEGRGDTDRSAFSNMELQQGAVDFLAQQHAQNKSIAASSFLHRMHLTDVATGFIRDGKPFNNVHWEIDDKTDYILVDNIELDPRDNEIKNRRDFRLAYRREKGLGWVEVYQRVPAQQAVKP